MNQPQVTPPEQPDDELKTFDMYHFFSRKDVLAVIALVVILLLMALYRALFGVAAV